MARAFPNCGHAADLEVASTLGTLSAADTNKAILALVLEHQIVSTQTSLVAIDKALKRPTGETFTRADVPLNLPAGWDYESVFGGKSPLVMKQRQAHAVYQQLAMLAKPAPAAPQQQVMLP